jgi:hypothetical protein
MVLKLLVSTLTVFFVSLVLYVVLKSEVVGKQKYAYVFLIDLFLFVKAACNICGVVSAIFLLTLFLEKL